MLDSSDPAGEESPRDRRSIIIATIAVFLGGLIFFLLTLGKTPYPGEAANAMLQQLGLAPLESLRFPIFHMLGRILTALPFGSTVTILHGWNALLSAATVALLFLSMSNLRYGPSSRRPDGALSTSAWVGALTAAALLSTSAPFWLAATRGFPIALHAFLVLLMVVVLKAYGVCQRFSVIVLFSLLYGACLMEAPSFVQLAPVFGAFVLVFMWNAGHADMKGFSLVAIGGLLGLSVVFLHALWFTKTQAFEWREFTGYGHVLRILLRDHYHSIIAGIPHVGWLTIGLFCIGPWFLLVALPRDSQSKRRNRLASHLLHGVLSGLAVAVFLGMRVSPWGLFKATPLVVIPYLFAASWAGYLAGYWDYLLRRRVEGRYGVPASSRIPLTRMFHVLISVGVVALAARNHSVVSDKYTGAPMRLARDIVGSLEGREWLVTNGAIDNLILLAAHEAGVRVHVLNRSLSQYPAYLRYVRSLLPDPRRRSLASLGLGPLLDDWFGGDDGAALRDIAVLDHADLWYAANKVAVPNRALFLGAEDLGNIDLTSVWRESEPLWKSIAEANYNAASVAGAPPPLPAMNSWVQSHYSKVANNFGVLCDDAAQPSLAASAYEMALSINPDNVSALLNLHGLAEAHDLPNREEIRNRFEAFVARLDQRIRIWGILHNHGYVRHPMAYMERGWAWAMAGRPVGGIRELERAVALGAEGQGIQLALGILYSRHGMDEQSEQSYYEVLRSDPYNATAILGLGRVAMRRGDFTQARSYFARVLELGTLPAYIVQFELASTELLSGNLELGRTMLEELAEKHPQDLRPAATLCIIAVEAGDDASIERYVSLLEAGGQQTPSSKRVLAHVAMSRNRLEEARGHLLELVAMVPDSIESLETLLRLDIRQGRQDEARRHTTMILRHDPGNALGNLVLGSLQYERGNLDEAESSFRASLVRSPSSEAWNSLAWVLFRQGRYQEAVVSCRDALRLNPRNGAAWDTLGVSLHRLGMLAQAEQALMRAVELQPHRPRILLHLAEVLLAQGQVGSARKMAEDLVEQGAQIPKDVYDEALRLLSSIAM